jgi:hypothetical protein
MQGSHTSPQQSGQPAAINMIHKLYYLTFCQETQNRGLNWSCAQGQILVMQNEKYQDFLQNRSKGVTKILEECIPSFD